MGRTSRGVRGIRLRSPAGRALRMARRVQPPNGNRHMRRPKLALLPLVSILLIVGVAGLLGLPRWASFEAAPATHLGREGRYRLPAHFDRSRDRLDDAACDLVRVLGFPTPAGPVKV